MIVSVNTQAYVFLCAVAAGAAVGLLYDFFRIMRKAARTSTVVTWIEDLIFWILVAVIIFATVYYSNEGELRSYIFLGTAIGTVLYALLLSRIVTSSSMFIIRIVKIITKFIWDVVTFPIRIFIRLLAIPARLAGNKAAVAANSLRKAGRNRLSKAAMWRKAFKNIRKKI